MESATGPPACTGIQPGDVILSVDGTPVERPEQLQQHLAGAGQHFALLIQRDDTGTFVGVDLA